MNLAAALNVRDYADAALESAFEDVQNQDNLARAHDNWRWTGRFAAVGSAEGHTLYVQLDVSDPSAHAVFWFADTATGWVSEKSLDDLELDQ